jgi:Na+/H+ antiporter NhaD/arsenite permease-like protein
MDSSILLVLAVLAVTVFFLVVDVVRIDVVAIVCMLALGWAGVLSPKEVFSGFSSNAVMAMMGVMILGQGIGERASWMFLGVKDGGKDRKNIVTDVLLCGLLWDLLEIGAAALFPGGYSFPRGNDPHQ